MIVIFLTRSNHQFWKYEFRIFTIFLTNLYFFCYSCNEHMRSMIIILLTRPNHQFRIFTNFKYFICYSCDEYEGGMIIILFIQPIHLFWIFMNFLSYSNIFYSCDEYEAELWLYIFLLTRSHHQFGNFHEFSNQFFVVFFVTAVINMIGHDYNLAHQIQPPILNFHEF